VFPQKVDDQGLLLVMLVFTAIILAVVGIGIGLFAYWSKKEKAKRERDVNTAVNLRR
jgi:hypothetical protein